MKYYSQRQTLTSWQQGFRLKIVAELMMPSIFAKPPRRPSSKQPKASMIHRHICGFEGFSWLQHNMLMMFMLKNSDQLCNSETVIFGALYYFVTPFNFAVWSSDPDFTLFYSSVCT